MCSIYGFLNTSNKVSHSTLERLIRNLSVEAEIRGTDATGIAYMENESIKVYKEPKPAHELRLRFPKGTDAVIGHTRLTTQGSETRNYNNHPFDGSCGSEQFALAHNGVLYNDKTLRDKLSLPPTCIETDSYIACQLLERYEELNMKNVKHMSEAICGSFLITILRNDNTLFITKGGNPIALYHFPELGLYVYASTAAILDKALQKIGIGKDYEDIKVHDGEILKISADGSTERMDFEENFSYYSSYRYSNYGNYNTGYKYNSGYKYGCGSYNKSYGWSLDDEEAEMPNGVVSTKTTLYEYGQKFGVSEHEINILLEYGYDAYLIEEMFYDHTFLDMALAEAKEYVTHV